jgi:hypothetical protein
MLGDLCRSATMQIARALTFIGLLLYGVPQLAAQQESDGGGLIANAEVAEASGATESEDVPKLNPDLPDVPDEEPNQKPVIDSIFIHPNQDTIVAGYPAALFNGEPVYATVTVNAHDPDGDYPLRYIMRSQSKNVPNDKSNVAFIPAKTPSRDDVGMYTIVIYVKDSRGATSQAYLKAIYVLDPYDDDQNFKALESVRTINDMSPGRLGFSRSPDGSGVPTRPKGTSSREDRASGISGAPIASVAAASSLVRGATPWRDPRVQACVHQYLDRVAFPVENRLEPGRHSRIDPWGRLVGPNLRATGPVDGAWENPTHFVWSQYDSARATQRYGRSLQDYTVDCLTGSETGLAETSRVPRDSGAPSPPTVVDLYHDAKSAIEEGNSRAYDGDVAGARASYDTALDALGRAQQADVTGAYARQLTSAIALVGRNRAQIASVSPDGRPNSHVLPPGLATGADAHDAFEALRRQNQVVFTDLEDVSTGPHERLKIGGTSITLRTTEFRYPLPERRAPAETPIVVLPHNFVSSPANHRFMGVSRGNVPDGQSKYEIILSEPVGSVGLMRIWNTNSLTRFYNAAGVLLAEHRNTKNHEFVSYVADSPENRIHRIEFDGIPESPQSRSNKIYQVGEVDNLYIGPLPGSQAVGARP